MTATRRPITTTSSVLRTGRNRTTSVGPGARIRPAHHAHQRTEQDLTEDIDPRNPGESGLRRPLIRTGDHIRRNTWPAI